MPAYFTVDGEPEGVLVIERSRFICSMKNVKSEDEARGFIEKVRKKYSLANHHCYAFVADEEGRSFRFSDDGEPQGTAGMPILNVLKSKRFYNTVAVVTRFFGGVKLGAGGLTRAYGNAVTECLKTAKIKDMRPVEFCEISVDYDGYAKILKIAESGGRHIVKTDFSEKADIVIAAKTEDGSAKLLKEKLSDAFKGKNVIKSSSFGYCDLTENLCRK